MSDLLEYSRARKEVLPRVLQAHHRWQQLKAAVPIAIVGLGIALGIVWILNPTWHAPKSWHLLALVWGGAFIFTGGLAAVGWRYASSRSLLKTAQTIDRKLETKNRLEALTDLRDPASPLGRAQLEETKAYLEQEPRARRPWLLPWLLTALAMLVLLHLATLLVWVVPPWLQAATPPPPATPPPVPVATLIWKSPEPETKANPIEEVPTEAIAESSSGLRNLTLEISVNGTPQKSVPIPDKPYDQPGKNQIKVSLYLDELGAQPFDIIAYYLRGRRIASTPLPDTTSEIQFVQVRPFRDDVAQADAKSTKAYDLLVRLKLAQLRSVKENFILAHTDLPVTNPVRAKENDRVGKNQGDLSAKTEEVVQAFILGGAPADMIDLLRQAEPFMSDASQKILATKNQEAVAPQQKALSLIVEVEKFFHKVMGKIVGGPTSPNPEDPFKDKQKHELKKRSDTPAGQIEQLAKNQAHLSHDLSQGEPPPGSDAPTAPDKSTPPGQATGSSSPAPSPAGPPSDQPAPQAVDPFGTDADKGTTAERQTRVLQGVGALLNTNNVLPAPVMADLQQARKDAAASLHQLDSEDAPGAREPAAQAASDLQRAIADMNEAGDQATHTAMQDAQDKLNGTARQLDGMAHHDRSAQPGQLNKMADQLHGTGQQLEKAADLQQEAGSAKDAEQLQNLAKAIQDQGVEKDLQQMSQTGVVPAKAQDDETKLEALARQAALGTLSEKPSAQELSGLIQSLERSRANLARLADKTGIQLNSPPQPMPGGQATWQGRPALAPDSQSRDGMAAPGTQSGLPQPSPQTGTQPSARPASPAQAGTQGQDGPKGPSGSSPEAKENAGQNSSKSSSQGETAASLPSPSSAPGTNPGGTAPGGNASAGGTNAEVKSATEELTQDLSNEVQQASVVLPSSGAATIWRRIQESGNVVQAYQSIAPPLAQLITDLEALETHLQRQELVTTPDLDQAPPSYRPAVSDYFESMSRDYHPSAEDGDAKKP